MSYTIAQVLTYVADLMSGALTESGDVAAVCLVSNRERNENWLIYASNMNNNLDLRLKNSQWSMNGKDYRLPEPKFHDSEEALERRNMAAQAALRLVSIANEQAGQAETLADKFLILDVISILQQGNLIKIAQPVQKGFVHAEMCLVNAVFMSCLGRPRARGEVSSYQLGVSKLCCGFCERFLDLLWDLGFHFHHLGTHGQTFESWPIPPFIFDSSVDWTNFNAKSFLDNLLKEMRKDANTPFQISIKGGTWFSSIANQGGTNQYGNSQHRMERLSSPLREPTSDKYELI